MKEKILYGVLALALIAFVCIPLPPSDLLIRMTRDWGTLAGSTLYYATEESPDFSDAQLLYAQEDPETQIATFRIPADAAAGLTGLRFDLPDDQPVTTIGKVSVSSGGVIQKSYLSCEFFADEHIASEHLFHRDLVPAQNLVALSVEGSDPYAVLSEDLVREIRGCVSRRRGIRAVFAVLILAGAILGRRRIFHLS